MSHSREEDRKPIASASIQKSSPTSFPPKRRPKISESDQRWLAMVVTLMQESLHKQGFQLQDIAAQLQITPRQLQRRFLSVSAQRPVEYLRELRLAQAHQYLQLGRFRTVREVCLAVGLSDAKYFTKRFKERYGKRPSEVLRR